jgi:DNA-binding CsgD family transcriptional regulator
MVIYRLYTDYSISAYQKANEQATHRNFRLANLLAEGGQTNAEIA